MMKDRSLGWPSVLSKSTQEASVDPASLGVTALCVNSH